MKLLTKHGNTIVFWGLVTIIVLSGFAVMARYFAFTNIYFNIGNKLIIYIVLFIMILANIQKLSLYNISVLSVVLLLLNPTLIMSPEYSQQLRAGLLITNCTITIAFMILFIKNRNTFNEKLTIKSFLLFFSGLIIGIVIAIIKINYNHMDLMSLAISHPIQYIMSLPISLSQSVVTNEFIFRGMLWGYLVEKNIKAKWIIILSSSLMCVIYAATSTIPEIIGAFIMGLFWGFLVMKTKSIDSSIGGVTGYNSFLIFQALYKN